MNIYIKGNDIVSIRGKVWGKIFTRKDGKVEIDTVSPHSTCYCLVAEERLRTDMVLSVMERFQQLTTQEMKWMRKNHGLAMKFIARQFEENSIQEG